MRPGRACSLLAMCALLAGGCGGGGRDGPPSACPIDSDQVVAALAKAPGPVRVHGVSLSDCLTKGSGSGEVQAIGGAYVRAAATLARRSPRDSRAALRLGYLIGAARKGAGSSEGVHAELVRRLEQEVATVGHFAAVRRGERAGRRFG